MGIKIKAANIAAIVLAMTTLFLATGCGGDGLILPKYEDVEGNVIVIIGDSIASHIDREAFASADPGFDFEGLFPPEERTGEGVTILNTAIGGNTITDIFRRFERDCTNYGPGVVIINGGTNDLYQGMTSKESYIAVWSKLLNDCEKKGIRAVVLGVVPSTYFSNSQMLDRDEWNAELKSITESHEGNIYVDPDPYVGAYRENGPEGNLWDIRPEYDKTDGLHFSDEGYIELARAILDTLGN